MFKLTKHILILAVLISQCLISVHAHNHELNFGIYGSERRNWVDAQNVPILRYIKEQIKTESKFDVKINTVFFPSYTDAVNALINKEIDFARLGAASYIEVKRRSPLVSIIAVESFKESTYHEGVIGVLKDSPIKNIKDLKGKSFAFGNEKSTIGRYLSQKFLVDNGITVTDLKGYEYLDRHDNVAIAIIRKTHDAGAFKISILNDKNFSDRIRILAKFKAPTQAWIAREGIDPALLASLKKVLLGIPKEMIPTKNRDAFVAADDSNFEYLRDSIDNNSKFFTK